MKSLMRCKIVCAVFLTMGAFGCARQHPSPKAIVKTVKPPQTLDAVLVAAVKKRDVKAVKSLLSRGANANARDDGARAAWKKSMAQTETGQDEQNDGPKIVIKPQTTTQGKNAPSFVGPTVLMIASYNADKLTIRALLDAGANIELRGVEYGGAKAAQEGDWNVDLETHVTPLIEAMMSGEPDTMRLLLQRGADVNAPDSRGVAPVGWANNMTPSSPPTPERERFLDRIFAVLKEAKAKGLRE